MRLQVVPEGREGAGEGKREGEREDERECGGSHLLTVALFAVDDQIVDEQRAAEAELDDDDAAVVLVHRDESVVDELILGVVGPD